MLRMMKVAAGFVVFFALLNIGEGKKKAKCPWENKVPRITESNLIGNATEGSWQQCGRRCSQQAECKSWRFEGGKAFDNCPLLKKKTKKFLEDAKAGVRGGSKDCPGACPEVKDLKCDDGEMECPGIVDPTTKCEGDGYCKQMTMPGLEDCKVFCTKYCEDNERICTSIDHPTGCEQEDTCIKKTYWNGAISCPNYCNPNCDFATDQECAGKNDENGCPGPMTCQPAMSGDCPQYCPSTECENGMQECPGIYNEFTGCTGAPYCMEECMA